MPVTAKFSRESYDKFGHEAVDELVNYPNQIDQTYRGELRELNEHNFARFDDKLERRASEIEAKIDQRTAELAKLVEQRIGQAESRLIRWTFTFWAPTALAMVSLMIAVMLKL